FFAKGNVDSSETRIQNSFFIPQPRNVFKGNVKLTQLKIVLVLARFKIHFGKHVNFIAKRRIHEQLRFINAKFSIRKLALGTGIKKRQSAFTANNNFPGFIGRPINIDLKRQTLAVSKTDWNED